MLFASVACNQPLNMQTIKINYNVGKHKSLKTYK